MKNLQKKTVLVLFTFLISNFTFGQDIPEAPTDKAVVYFTRSSSLGFLINFSYFDNDKLIGKFNGPKYIRYECEPGKHLFWAQSENKDFVEAEIEPGKIYFIEALVKMGILTAQLGLLPIDPNDSKRMQNIFALISERPSESFTVEELEKETKNKEGVIQDGLEKYNKDKKKGKPIKTLDKYMFYTN